MIHAPCRLVPAVLTRTIPTVHAARPILSTGVSGGRFRVAHPAAPALGARQLVQYVVDLAKALVVESRASTSHLLHPIEASGLATTNIEANTGRPTAARVDAVHVDTVHVDTVHVDTVHTPQTRMLVTEEGTAPTGAFTGWGRARVVRALTFGASVVQAVGRVSNSRQLVTYLASSGYGSGIVCVRSHIGLVPVVLT